MDGSGARRQGTERTIRASIWAQDVNGVLGDGHRMLWRVPGDFAFFKEQTMGCPLIMGRASFEALGRPLPGRTNIVLTTNEGYSPEGVIVAHSLDQAFFVAEQVAQETNAHTVCVIGGAHVYAATMDMVDRLVVTDLDLEVAPEPGTRLVYAPAIDADEWEIVSEDPTWREHSGDARWRVTVYQRRSR